MNLVHSTRRRRLAHKLTRELRKITIVTCGSFHCERRSMKTKSSFYSIVLRYMCSDRLKPKENIASFENSFLSMKTLLIKERLRVDWTLPSDATWRHVHVALNNKLSRAKVFIANGDWWRQKVRFTCVATVWFQRTANTSVHCNDGKIRWFQCEFSLSDVDKMLACGCTCRSNCFAAIVSSARN